MLTLIISTVSMIAPSIIIIMSTFAAGPTLIFAERMNDYQLRLYPIEQVAIPSRPKRSPAAISTRCVESTTLEHNSASATPSSCRKSVAGFNRGVRRIHIASSSDERSFGGDCNRGRLLEQVPFDPFTDSRSARVLMQPARSNLTARQDPEAVLEFRSWISQKFPSVLSSLESLEIIPKRLEKTKDPSAVTPAQSQSLPLGYCEQRTRYGSPHSAPSNSEDRYAGSDEGYADQEGLLEAEYTTWALLFEHATLVALAPDDEFVTQGKTPAGDVFFILTGTCDLTFYPDFLAVLISHRDRQRRRTRSPSKHQHPRQQGCSPVDLLSSPCRVSTEGQGLDRRLSISKLSADDVQAAVSSGLYLRSLLPGDFFGLDADLFAFPHHIVTATSRGARQRNSLGVTMSACMHVLRVSTTVLNNMRKCIFECTKHPILRKAFPSASISLPAFEIESFPYLFDHEIVEFLRGTFLFTPMNEARLRFLAAHTRPYRVKKHEFLFTEGQRVSTFLVRSGQLTLRVETRTVELEILQAHDCVGLLETCLMESTFSRYCVSSSSDVCVLVISPVAMLTALAQEPESAALVADSLLCRHNWYALRLFTARNQHNPQREFKLSLSAQQRRSPIPCSRCGWTGHVSTSSNCLRGESLNGTVLTRQIIVQASQRQNNSSPTETNTTSDADGGPFRRRPNCGQLLHTVHLATLVTLSLRHNQSHQGKDAKSVCFPAIHPPPFVKQESPHNVTKEGSVRERIKLAQKRLNDSLQVTNESTLNALRAGTAPSSVVSQPLRVSPAGATGRTPLQKRKSVESRSSKRSDNLGIHTTSRTTTG